MEFTLDVSKWRCGNDGPNRLGSGPTRLLNGEGYQCCLGQFSLQCMNVTEDDISGLIDPESLFVKGRGADECDSKILVKKEEYVKSFYHYENTRLSNIAITINDDSNMSNEDRIKGLKKLFKTHGHSITVINDDILRKG